MRLRCISRYRSAILSVEVGQVLSDLTDDAAHRLMADAPGCWEDADATAAPDKPPADTKAPDKPPVDKMIKAPPVKK